MANREQNSKMLTWSNTSTTLGAVGLTAIMFTGSAAVGTITVQDGTAIKTVVQVASTAPTTLFSFQPASAFTNLNTVITGTASYTLLFVPRP